MVAVPAVSFDADQTLWDFSAVHKRALDSTLDAMVRRGDTTRGQLTVADLQAAREEVMRPLRGKPHDLAVARELSFRLVLERQGHDDPVEAARALIDDYLRVRFDTIKLYPEVADCLKRIGSVTRIGLLTNGNTDPQRCGLPNLFDAVVMGPELGIRKPQAEAFEAMAEALHLSPTELWHVGDDENDIDGANAVAATSVYIVRDRRRASLAARADHTITSLTELEELLKDGS